MAAILYLSPVLSLLDSGAHESCGNPSAAAMFWRERETQKTAKEDLQCVSDSARRREREREAHQSVGHFKSGSHSVWWLMITTVVCSSRNEQ